MKRFQAWNVPDNTSKTDFLAWFFIQRAWSTLKKSIIMISLLICFIGLTATYMSEKIKNDSNQDLNELFVQNGNIVSTTISCSICNLSIFVAIFVMNLSAWFFNMNRVDTQHLKIISIQTKIFSCKSWIWINFFLIFFLSASLPQIPVYTNVWYFKTQTE